MMDAFFFGSQAVLIAILVVNMVLSALTAREIRRKNRIIDRLKNGIQGRDAVIEELKKRLGKTAESGESA